MAAWTIAAIPLLATPVTTCSSDDKDMLAIAMNPNSESIDDNESTQNPAVGKRELYGLPTSQAGQTTSIEENENSPKVRICLHISSIGSQS
ncbi:hypothetical protein [Vacuolonema iberomarrocanum]|uniref:hypothetical protein n=1 Tax=Vacuolonema iberomarrocanum TaxID=3454632 RepID=UPI0019DA9A8B|nr:hypothetical protein [filamentous cyanobacterium LEGE 07170]